MKTLWGDTFLEIQGFVVKTEAVRVKIENAHANVYVHLCGGNALVVVKVNVNPWLKLAICSD